MTHTFIPETEAAALTGYAPGVFRRKVKGTMYRKSKDGSYVATERLPITFTTGGKSYRYSKQDIEKYLRKTASR